MRFIEFLKREDVKFVVKIALFCFTASGFMCFICEEGMQMMSFGAFAYNNAKDYEGLKEHVKVMEAVHQTSSFLIKFIGWLNPIMYPAYLQYLDTNEAYIVSQRALIKKNLD